VDDIGIDYHLEGILGSVSLKTLRRHNIYIYIYIVVVAFSLLLRFSYTGSVSPNGALSNVVTGPCEMSILFWGPKLMLSGWFSAC
jgi:hypothetical protein